MALQGHYPLCPAERTVTRRGIAMSGQRDRQSFRGRLGFWSSLARCPADIPHVGDIEVGFEIDRVGLVELLATLPVRAQPCRAGSDPPWSSGSDPPTRSGRPGVSPSACPGGARRRVVLPARRSPPPDDLEARRLLVVTLRACPASEPSLHSEVASGRARCERRPAPRVLVGHQAPRRPAVHS